MYDRTAFVEVNKFYSGEVDFKGMDIKTGSYSLDITGFGSYNGHGFGDISDIIAAVDGYNGYDTLSFDDVDTKNLLGQGNFGKNGVNQL